MDLYDPPFLDVTAHRLWLPAVAGILPRFMDATRNTGGWPVLLLAFLALLASGRGLHAQDITDASLADRPISEIVLEGVKDKDRQLVLNNIRSAVGDPFDADTVRSDGEQLHRLGRFKFITQRAELLEDGTVRLIFTVQEQPVIQAVQVVGNKLISDQELLAVVLLRRGLPQDDFRVQKSKQAIERLYQAQGHYHTTVEVDSQELSESGILIFRVIEGPQVKIKAIEFQGNKAFNATQLGAQIRTRKAVFIISKGQLDEDILDDDVGKIDNYYKQRGYLNVRVDRRIDLSPDNTEAKVTFLINEGRQFTLRSVHTTPEQLSVFTTRQIAAMMEIKPGDVYSADKLKESKQIIEDAYRIMGYIDIRVDPRPNRVSDEPIVDLEMRINEGKKYLVGDTDIQGNFLTKDKVIRRLIRLQPGRPFDGTEIARSQRRIERTRLFNEVKATIQNPDPNHPLYRDILFEVKERNTGSFNFGVAVGSDSGAFGEFSVNQNNFDIADFPESLNEYISGRSFRGAGQQFNMVVRPGNEFFQYLISLTEPHIFESEYAMRLTGSFRDRRFENYDEERISAQIGLGRQVGDVWRLDFNFRAEEVELDDIDDDAPTVVFAARGPNMLTSMGVSLTRTTIESINRPGRGSRLELGIEQIGALGGDFTFTKLRGEYTVFLTLFEDFLGRKSTLRLNTRASYIFGEDAPIYERFFLGGRTFRGFQFRTVSPKGIRANTGLLGDDPIGGQFLFFAGAQYEFPVFQDAVSAVFFIDSGTVTDDFELDEYRASIGVGVRISVPALGPAPLAFDLALPILSEEGDESEVFSFSVALPFN